MCKPKLCLNCQKSNNACPISKCHKIKEKEEKEKLNGNLNSMIVFVTFYDLNCFCLSMSPLSVSCSFTRRFLWLKEISIPFLLLWTFCTSDWDSCLINYMPESRIDIQTNTRLFQSLFQVRCFQQDIFFT